jgi:Ca2+-binding RTX toxin-like protein
MESTHPRIRHAVLLAGLACPLALALPVSALAAPATATRSAGVVTLTGDTGVVSADDIGNYVRPIDAGGGLVLQERGDAGRTLVAGSGCAQVSPKAVSCGTTAGLTSLVFNLTPGQDRVDFDYNDPTLLTVPRTIHGGDGDDLFKGLHGADTIDGGPGTDLISGLGGVDSLTGGPGDDRLAPGCTEDGVELIGGICTGDGADTVDGGAGIDQLSYWNHSDPVSVTLGAGGAQTNANGSAGDGDHVSGIENVEGTREAENTIAGNDADNEISGSIFLDRLSGGGGDDVIESGTDYGNAPLYFDANDIVDGGPGVDEVRYERSAAVHLVLADPGAPPTTGNGSGSESDSLVNVENVLGGDKRDTLTGSSAANLLDGGYDDDTLDGRGGNDRLIGGGGGDTVSGGGGDDTLDLDGDGAPDSAACGDGTDTVYADDTDVVAADCETVERPSGGNPGGGNPGGGNPGGGNPGGGTTTPTTTATTTTTQTAAVTTTVSPFPAFAAFSAGLAGVNAFKAAATRSGQVTVPPARFDAYGFTCAQACTATLNGQVVVVPRAASAARTKPLKLKTARFSGGAGAAMKVAVSLPAKAVRAIKQSRSAKLTLVTVIASGGKSVRLPATIRLKRKR